MTGGGGDYAGKEGETLQDWGNGFYRKTDSTTKGDIRIEQRHRIQSTQ